jgi:hypothetical protein
MATSDSISDIVTTTTSRLKPKQPERYNGSRDRQVIDNWISSVDSYFALTRAQPPDIYHYLNTIFVDNAATWFRYHFKPELAEQLQWDTVKQHLRGYFLPPNNLRRLRDEWANLRQTTNVADYYIRFTNLAMQLTVNGADIDQATLVDKFIRGLKSKTRTEVELRDPQSLDEATRIADRYDNIVYRDTFSKFQQSQSRPFWQQSSYQDDNRGEPMQIDALRTGNTSDQQSAIQIDAFKPKSQSSKLKKLTDAERAHLRSIHACFKCRQPGHMARDCPTQKNSSKNSKRQ